MREAAASIDRSKRQALGKMLGIGTAWTAADLLRPPNTAAAQGAPAHGGGHGNVFNIKFFGAAGDGKTLDTPALNKAMEAAAAAGGGTVFVPAGTYLCFSIRLKSNVALYLDQGSTLLGATPPEGGGSGYDAPEPGPGNHYEDYGHRHWHNALIWGVGIENVSITGPGLIYGKGLLRTMGRNPVPGHGDKCIGLKNCHNVTLRDFSILHGGHFGILATGVDNLLIDHLTIDTERDGMDIDCCRNVRVTNTTVNSPFDDGICPKSSYALGYARATENLMISNCFVTGGYEVGSVVDGTWKQFPEGYTLSRFGRRFHVPRTGRIKCGTESTGGFKNITISNCVFDRCQGLALETVDGAHLEDVSITNVTMRNIVNMPFFLRLGARMRAPAGTAIGKLRRVNISNVVVSNTAGRYASILSGIPGHEIEDVRLNGIYVLHQGGGTKADAAIVIPEKESGYPEPTMFGTTPSYGFFLRHIKGLEMSDIEIRYEKEDARPPFILDDVKDADFFHVSAQHAPGVSVFSLNNVEDFSVRWSKSVPDTHLETVRSKTL